MLGLLPSAAALAGASVEAVGLFKDRAFLRTATGAHMVRAGETIDGVTLVSSTADEAVVNVGDRQLKLHLSTRINSRFKAPDQQQLSIVQDQVGQYRAQGMINNQLVGFLVDTGASVVAMSSNQADALGLNYRQVGELGSVVTAQGQTKSYFVILDNVSIGGVTVNNVRGAVIEGGYPIEVLLGTSFLRQIAMDEQDGVLTLTQKY